MASCALLLFSALFAVGFCQTVHKMAIRSDIRFRFATTEVMCVMSNDEDRARELVFDVTLPKEAFIANFSMEIEGKVYPGHVKEKQKARQQYLAARQSGSSGGLVEQNARHSNKFDVSVNIAAGSNVTFNLIYQELLRRRFGAYEHSVYIAPGHDVGEFSVEVYIQERAEIQDVRTPALRKDIINNAVEEDENSLTQISQPTPTTAHIIYRPSPEALKEEGEGWFVVQYDVDTQNAGQLLVVDGYFVHFFMPPDDLPPLPLDIVFVLDISGSMSGHKIEQLKDAMGTILDDLRPTDRFTILLFDGEVQLWRPSLQEASDNNLDTARHYVQRINSRGSTDIHQALMRGLELLQGSRETSRVPMMFFLTDGEATAGVRDPKRIVDDVSTRNEGVVNIYSLAFGSGADYKLLRQISSRNKGFARKIYEASDASTQVSGLYREISTIVMRNLAVVYHPTSNNDDGDVREMVKVDNSSVTVCSLPTLFGQGDFVVAGKLDNPQILLTAPEQAGGLVLKVSGLGAAGQMNFVLEEDDLSRLTLDGEDPPFWGVPRDLSRITERTWAFLTIKQLLEEKTAAQENAELVKELDARILDLSLKYHFVTPLTSMVVTRPEDDLNKEKSAEASLVNDDQVKAAERGAVGPALQASHSYRAHSRPAALPMLPPRYPSSPKLYSRVLASDPAMHGVGDRGPSLPATHFLPMPTHSSYQHWATRTAYPIITTSPTPWRGDTKLNGRKKNRYLARTMTYPITTTSPSPPTAGGPQLKKDGGRTMKRKRCTRNKVLLRSVMVKGQKKSGETPVTCYELKAARETHNYTLLDDPSVNTSVILALRRRVMTSLLIQEGRVFYRLHVNSEGDVYFSDDQSSNASPKSSLRVGRFDVTASVIKKKCKAVVIDVEVTITDDNNDASVVRGYQGFAAKGLKSTLKDNSRRRRRTRKRKNKNKNKNKRKVKVSKSCQANNVPADQSYVLRGKKLLRYKHSSVIEDVLATS